MVDIIAEPCATLQGEAIVPGDKSISHRVLILGALSTGTTCIEGLLEGLDCLHTLKALQDLGVDIKRLGPGRVEVAGVGTRGFKPPSQPLDCGNSGTTMRLLAGLLAAQPFSSVLVGDSSLHKRPMRRIIIPLTQMGAQIDGNQKDSDIYPPLHIQGTSSLRGIDYALPIASAQVKSCLLLAGLCASGKTTIIESAPTRDHTEKMLAEFGCPLSIHGQRTVLSPVKSLQAQSVAVPGDFSSAAFFIAGASFTLGAHLYLKNIGVNPTRTGLIHILKEMGAKIFFHEEREVNGEKRADIEVQGAQLQGIKILPQWVTSSIDEFPVLFIVAACAQGQTQIRGVKELRYKESDRITVMTQGLKRLGVQLEEYPDGVLIEGTTLKGGKVNSQGDHRVAMAFLMGSLNAKEPIHVENCDNIATSFPHFQHTANQLGLALKIS